MPGNDAGWQEHTRDDRHMASKPTVLMNRFIHRDDIFGGCYRLQIVARSADPSGTFENLQVFKDFSFDLFDGAERKRLLVIHRAMEDYFVAEIADEFPAAHRGAPPLNRIEQLDSGDRNQIGNDGPYIPVGMVKDVNPIAPREVSHFLLI